MASGKARAKRETAYGMNDNAKGMLSRRKRKVELGSPRDGKKERTCAARSERTPGGVRRRKRDRRVDVDRWMEQTRAGGGDGAEAEGAEAEGGYSTRRGEEEASGARRGFRRRRWFVEGP